MSVFAGGVEQPRWEIEDLRLEDGITRLTAQPGWETMAK